MAFFANALATYWWSVGLAVAAGVVLNVVHDIEGPGVAMAAMLILYSLALYSLLVFGVLAAATDLSVAKRALWSWAGPPALLLAVAVPGTLLDRDRSGMGWGVVVVFLASMPGQVMATPIIKLRKHRQEQRDFAATPDPCTNDVLTLQASPHVSLEADAVAGHGDGLLVLVTVRGPKLGYKLVRLLPDGRLDPGYPPNTTCIDYRHHRDSMFVTPEGEIRLFSKISETDGSVRFARDGQFLGQSGAKQPEPNWLPSPAKYHRDWQGNVLARQGSEIYEVDEWNPAWPMRLLRDLADALPTSKYDYLDVFRGPDGLGALVAQLRENNQGRGDILLALEGTGFRPGHVRHSPNQVLGILDDGSFLVGESLSYDRELWLVPAEGEPDARHHAFAAALETQRARMKVTAAAVLPGNRVALAGLTKDSDRPQLTTAIIAVAPP